MNSPTGTKVLIVEDDEAVRQTLADILELNGFVPFVAANGHEGLQAAKANHPAVILTDIAMPGMDGFQLIGHLRTDPVLRAVPVIVISAKVDRPAARQGMELGADDFITKPFTEEEVIHSINARLEKKQLLDELDAFAHTVAHDLKNPLCTLTMRLELLARSLAKGDVPAASHDQGEALHAANRLASIIEELLVLSGVRRQEVESQPVNMAAAVEEAVSRLEQLILRHGAVIERPAAWPESYGHAPWIIEVWVNYISNAVKYAGPHPRITLGGARANDGLSARFWVQDGGPGLDEATQRTLFVPFTRITTVRAVGHGLGLSIVRRIVEKLGGKVGVDSRPGQGARFWFELPATLRPQSASPFVPAIAL
ncbi:MAG: HAMP domain-containing histidine kinase [Verrucomicrobia bacterium]|nr:HAMP domain-containing histidine kinase [Verrucomicrobiota bacterium]